MSPYHVLASWASACNHTGVQWYLYKETLLCANGHHALPEDLCAQIVVRGRDLPALVEYVFPKLPANWILNKLDFLNAEKMLVFSAEDTPVLEIHVLYAVNDDAQVDTISAIRSRAVKKIICLQNTDTIFKKLCFLGSLRKIYSKTIGKIIRWRLNKLLNKSFLAVVALAGESNEALPFYSDCFTNKKPALFPKDWFAGTVMLDCQIGADTAPTHSSLPAFSAYRAYLESVYGDYENGLFDEIGCGLTVEEKEDLKKHQSRCFEALTFLQTLSEEFGLRYYLLAGSVLGAVRHGGFIPWDDDIDIGIRIEEIEKFEEVVKANMTRLPEGFTFLQPGVNNSYPRMFSKICYEGRCCIDLWPLVPTYTNGFKATYLWYFSKLITKSHYEHIGQTVANFRMPARLINFFLNDRIVMFLARRNERRYAHKNAPAYINLYSIYLRPKETIRREWLDTQATALFNGLEVPVVGCTEVYLTHLYGNYMTKPVPWKRASRHFDRFDTTEPNL